MPTLINATAKVVYSYDELAADAGLSDVVFSGLEFVTADNRMQLEYTKTTPLDDTPAVSDPDAVAATYSWTGDDLASLAGLGWGETAIVSINFDTSTDPVVGLRVDLAKV